MWRVCGVGWGGVAAAAACGVRKGIIGRAICAQLPRSPVLRAEAILPVAEGVVLVRSG